jgi:hypothetical protein
MGPDPVVLAAPPLDQHLRLQQRVEDFAVQKLVPQLAVEALDVAVLPRAPRPDKQRADSEPPEPFAVIVFE